MIQMPSYATLAANAGDGKPFANGTEGEAWQSGWCLREGAPCRHDTIDRGGDLSCPLMEIAILGGTPAEWGERTSALGRDMYTCTMYEAEEVAT